MREIKFRAWDKEFKKYIGSAEYVIDPYNGEVGELSGYEILAVNHNAVLEQFTGLHDKNGKEIYEGDIIEWIDYETKRIGYVDFNPDIEFVTANYIFKFGNFAYQDTENYLTIVGDIHENPELMESKKEK